MALKIQTSNHQYDFLFSYESINFITGGNGVV